MKEKRRGEILLGQTDLSVHFISIFVRPITLENSAFALMKK